MQRSSKPAAIVFDFDGTIADTEWPIYEMYRDAYEAHGLTLPLDEWVDCIGKADNLTLPEQLEELLGHAPDTQIVDDVMARRRKELDALGTRDGVRELIAIAQADGIPLAVASSSPSAWVDPHLERLGLTEAFPVVRTRDHVDRGKPAPDLYLAAAAMLGVDPSQAVAIEDSRHGCRAAKTAGMWCAVVPHRITSLDLPDDADLILDSLSEFPLARFGLG